MNKVIDPYGRTFQTLRVSLSESCSMSCVYCVHSESSLSESNADSTSAVLTVEGYLSIIQSIHHITPLSTIRLTGGEPLLFKPLPELIKGIVNLGISSIKITTNGLQLFDRLSELKEAGLRSINISLDALDPDTFYSLTRVNKIKKVLDGIEAAVSSGLEVKLNTVVLKNFNEHQIVPLLEYAAGRNIPIRFLELMSMGYLNKSHELYFVSQEEILDIIQRVTTIARIPRSISSTANYWMTARGWKFGVIANSSEPFCMDCNRLRLDSYGNIWGCLSSTVSYSAKNKTQDELQKILAAALATKQTAFSGSALSMKYIGG